MRGRIALALALVASGTVGGWFLSTQVPPRYAAQTLIPDPGDGRVSGFLKRDNIRTFAERQSLYGDLRLHAPSDDLRDQLIKDFTFKPVVDRGGVRKLSVEFRYPDPKQAQDTVRAAAAFFTDRPIADPAVRLAEGMLSAAWCTGGAIVGAIVGVLIFFPFVRWPAAVAMVGGFIGAQISKVVPPVYVATTSFAVRNAPPISRQVGWPLSDEDLSHLITRFNLYDDRDLHIEMKYAVARLRRDIKIVRDADEPDVFDISFANRNWTTAQSVIWMANTFVTENYFRIHGATQGLQILRNDAPQTFSSPTPGEGALGGALLSLAVVLGVWAAKA